MFSKKLMGRKMFQEGGMVTPSMPLPPSGGIVDGLGLNAPEAMPPIPAQDQAMLTEGMADMAGKLGQVDAAEDTASLINAIRSDNLTLDDRYTELAKYVGRADATKTPESVLTLVQPTFELIEQGGGMNMLGSDALQGTGPMEESMSATLTETPMGDTATMTETMETPTLFNKGGLAVKKPKAPVYRSNGSPMIGEMASFSDYPRNTGAFDVESNPYLAASNILTTPVEPVSTSPITDRLEATRNAELERRRAALRSTQAADDPINYNNMMQLYGTSQMPNYLTRASIQSRSMEGIPEPRTAPEILESYREVANADDLVPIRSAEEYQKELEEITAPSREIEKTPEELLQERKDFIGEMDNSPQALFALAQSFNTLANKPGTLLQGLAAAGGQAAESLAPIAREQEILDRQMKTDVFDRHQELLQRIRDEDRQIALSAYDSFRADRKGNEQFKLDQVMQALERTAVEADNYNQLLAGVNQVAVEAQADWSNNQKTAIADMLSPMSETEIDGAGRITGMVPELNSSGQPTGRFVPKAMGIIGEDAERYFAQPFTITGAEPNAIMPAPDAVPVDDFAALPLSEAQAIRSRIKNRASSIKSFEDILKKAFKDVGTGPESQVKAFLTNSFGALGADWAKFHGEEENRFLLATALRDYIRAEALSDRYALGEQAILAELLDLDSQFWRDPEAAWHRVRTVMTNQINRNEYDWAIVQNRPFAQLEYTAAATPNDPLPWSNQSSKDYIGLAQEQGKTGTWWVEFTPEEALLQDPATNPNEFESIDMVRMAADPNSALYDPNSPQYVPNLIKPSDSVAKYDEFLNNGNNIVRPLTLTMEEDGVGVAPLNALMSQYTLSPEELKTVYQQGGGDSVMTNVPMRSTRQSSPVRNNQRHADFITDEVFQRVNQ